MIRSRLKWMCTVCTADPTGFRSQTKMPKAKHMLPPRIASACPNPHCTSRARVFQNVQKHISQKPDCMAYAQAWRQAYSAQYPSKSCVVDAFTQSLICQEITPDESLDNIPMDDTVSFPDDNDNFINIENDIADPHNAIDTNDFEHTNFQQFLGVNELEALVNPTQALFTNARLVEGTLLKILTKLEAPHWAFKIIMNWACDAAQTGYKFIPQQESYRSQLQIITKWVGMKFI
jgi:hypothetical protein